MQKELKNLLKLSLAFIAIFLFFSVARVYFYFSNQAILEGSSDFSLLNALTNGFVYDVKFIFLVNSITILMYFLPFRFRNTIFWQFIVKLLFTGLNSSLIFLYLSDSKHYKIIAEHIKFSNNLESTLFEQFSFALNKINFQFSNSWDIVLISLFSFIVLWSSFPSINKMYFERSKANVYFRFVITFLAAFLIWKSVNEINDKSGDWQLDVFARMNKSTAVLAINSPYYMMRYYNSEKQTLSKYFDENELKTQFSAKKHYFSRQKNKKNVIIINYSNKIDNWQKFEKNVEKLSENYFISDNFSTKTKNIPNQLDEILLSFPAFDKKALIKTPYAFNEFKSLAELLKQNGYLTVFAANGSDKKLYKSLYHFYGFDQLILKKKNHKLLSKFEQLIKGNSSNDSFFAFFQMDNGIDELINYITDNKLDSNTVIVINIQAENTNELLSRKCLYLLPNSKNKYSVSSRTQKLDIFPSIIDYLNLNEKFIAFGKSVFYKTKKHEVFQHTGNEYVILEDSLLLRYNGQSTKWIVDYKNDPEEFFDLQDSLPVQKVLLENKIRAIIQENSQRLINNRMLY